VSFPAYIDRATAHGRLQLVFPEGTPQRNYCVREMAASAVFVMLYIGAIEGSGNWLAPKHVMRMTEEQSKRQLQDARDAYRTEAMRPAFRAEGQRWYEENSREALRDETIRQGFITNNAVIERQGLPTTSSLPRYALKQEFAELFDPALAGAGLEQAIAKWQNDNLSAQALARTVLMRRGAITTGEGVLVKFPNGETRRMSPGPSSIIAKAVIEEFARLFLTNPSVLWVSESGAKIVARDDELAAMLNLRITADRNLPDIILIDLGDTGTQQFLLIFVEVVATDGAITAQRQAALAKIATDAGFPASRLAFVTAYLDRSHGAFKKSIAELAWRSFAWFAAEPQQIISLHDASEVPVRLRQLLGHE
jgi:BsuBI/PstI restriction endonuclease domain/BsuBI/PstI restriction endonuclease HTH domain